VATKHEQILHHIEGLKIGSRISVRRIAKELGVSEGTAYRAIKEAELRGLVSAMDRIGTVRIEAKEKKNIERLTFAEVLNIVEGTVLGGRDGLHKTLSKFVIGAMQLQAIVRYIEPGSLMIVGNREQVHKLSLENGAAVLITGDFAPSEEVQRLANEKQLPLISCSYDTFTTASLINRAIYDRLIKKDILFVEDICVPNPTTVQLGENVQSFLEVVDRTGHTRMPVVDHGHRVMGIISASDVAESNFRDRVEQHMVKQPFAVTPKTTVASAAHRMVWEGMEILPVVENRQLVGVISRQDVLKAFQSMNRQPQVAETLADTILQGFQEVRRDNDGLSLIGKVTPQMTSAAGILGTGSLITLVEYGAILCLERNRRVDMVVENVTLYSLKPVSVDANIEIRCRILDNGRRFGKVEVGIYDGNERAGKALLTTQMLER